MAPWKLCLAVSLATDRPDARKRVRQAMGEELKAVASALNLKVKEKPGPEAGLLPGQPVTLIYGYACYSVPSHAPLPGATLGEKMEALAERALARGVAEEPRALLAVGAWNDLQVPRAWLACEDRRRRLELPPESWKAGQPNEHWPVRLLLQAFSEADLGLLGGAFPQSRQSMLEGVLPVPGRPRPRGRL